MELLLYLQVGWLGILDPAKTDAIWRRQWIALGVLLSAISLLPVFVVELYLGANIYVLLATFLAFMLLAYLAGFLGEWIIEESKHN